MILELIQSYISQKAELVNANYQTNIQLKQIITELELEHIGASESFIHYQLFVSSIENQEFENDIIDNVNVKLDFVILVANKNYTVYKKIFDRYLFAFRRVLRRSKQPLMAYNDEDISSGLTLLDISDVRITDADRFEDDYYKPSIEFTLMISDDNRVGNQILKSETA